MIETALNFRFAVDGLYFLSALFYIRNLTGSAKKTGTYFFLTGLFFNLVESLLRGAESGGAGGSPFSSISGFISVYCLLTGISYLFCEVKFKQTSLGAFHVPVIFLMHLVSSVLKQPIQNIPAFNTGFLFSFHAIFNVFAYSFFTVGFVASLAYLTLDSQIRRKKYGNIMKKLPSLHLVERVNTFSISTGIPLATVGMIAGFFLAFEREQTSMLSNVKIYLTLLTILVFSTQLVFARYLGWKGRRSMALCVLGFVLIIFSVTFVNLYFSPLHVF